MSKREGESITGLKLVQLTKYKNLKFVHNYHLQKISGKNHS